MNVWRTQFLRQRVAPGSGRPFAPSLLLALWVFATFVHSIRAENSRFEAEIRPLLLSYCADCHADGANKGSVDFDAVSSEAAALGHPELWLRVLKNVRAGIMPPRPRKSRPSAAERQRLEDWIIYEAFGVDPRNPDPGRVTIRRLNRAEYRNTIRDLMGVDFDVDEEFPADDTGHGFDNIGDVLTLSPMLMEKYLTAAKEIVGRAVPNVARVPPERHISGRKFQRADLEPGTGGATAPGKNYERFFPEREAMDAGERRRLASDVLRTFAAKAFRRPVDEGTVERLTGLAESIYCQPGQTLEAGVGQGMVAVLASPRFLFREEATEPLQEGQVHPWVDEYSLASRLSYFLWSSMPDETLLQLAGRRELRSNLTAQVTRMLSDSRSSAFIRNFTGQWLQARDIETVPIEARAVLLREEESDPEIEQARRHFRALRNRPPEGLSAEEKEELAKARAAFSLSQNRFARYELTGTLRQDMRRETEKYFEYVIRENRNVLELLDSDYTFLNQRLADQYGIPNVEGDELRLVKLPPNSPRGGLLTQGTVLAVTSNPTRTSPVKRGLFILENIFAMPPAPPPPNIPPLEAAAKGLGDREPSLRETLALHRASALCSSCHNRMDPLGLALENFNALGRWREKERGQPIEASGTLVTGEEFKSVQELKRILVAQHGDDFYRGLTEKLLTYSLGRGLEYYDTFTIDRIVERLRQEGGRPAALLMGIVESPAFQQRRRANWPEKSAPVQTSQQRADLRGLP